MSKRATPTLLLTSAPTGPGATTTCAAEALAAPVEGLRPRRALDVRSDIGEWEAAEPYDLRSLDEAVLNALGFEQMMGGLVAAVAPALGAATCGVMIWEPAENALRLIAGSFGANETATASYRATRSDTGGNAARVFTTGMPFVNNRAAGRFAAAFGIRRLLTLPLAVGEHRTGVIHFANREAPFEPKDVMVAKRLAPRVAMSIEYFRNLQKLRREQHLERNLRRVAEAIASDAPLECILELALDELLLLSSAQRVTLSVRDTEPILRGCERVDDPGRAALHVPLLVSGEHLGTLSLLRSSAEPLAEDERTAMERVADLIVLAWATQRGRQERAARARLRERERIAEDLHDHAAQILFAAKTALESTLESPRLAGTSRATVARARGLLARGEEALRDVIEELCPDNDGDPAEHLERVVQEVEERFDIAVHLELPRTRLPLGSSAPAVTDLLVKVCREALVNAAKHAGPSRVSVSLQRARDGRLLLTVQDDGIGIAGGVSHDGHGLKALRRVVRERGGAMRVARGPHGGTKLTVSIDP
jgi:signal transduction histidine kinase